MPASLVIAFLCGCLSMLLLMGLCIFHLERQNHQILRATRSQAYNRGYTDGYAQARRQ